MADSRFVPDPDAEVYTLWTIQNEQVYRDVQADGVYHVDPSRILFPESDEGSAVCNHAYKWLCERMRERIGEASDPDARYPIWAWFKDQGKPHGKPDMRESGHAQRGEKVVRLKLAIPRQRVLLSDFDDWHFALNYWYLADGDADEECFDAELERRGISFPELQSLAISDDDELSDIKAKIEKSWDKIFDITRPAIDGWNFEWNMRSIQATFWELHESDIVNVEYFTAR